MGQAQGQGAALAAAAAALAPAAAAAVAVDLRTRRSHQGATLRLGQTPAMGSAHRHPEKLINFKGPSPNNFRR